MENKVVSKRQLNRKYKGYAPFRADNFIAWISKLLFQVLIFTIIYTIYIEKIRSDYNNNFFIEILFVFLWLIFSDFLALILSSIIKIVFNYLMGYLANKKRKNKNYNRKGIEYFLFTSFRCLSYVFGLTLLLSSLFSLVMPIWGGFFAYLSAWILVFFTSKILARIISISITKTV